MSCPKRWRQRPLLSPVTALERVERDIVSGSLISLPDPEMAPATHREVARKALRAMLDREATAAPRTLEQADADRAQAEAALAALRQALRQALRLRDVSPAVGPATEAAASLGLDAEIGASRPIAQAAMGGLVEIGEVALAVEDGATVEEASRALRERHFDGKPLEEIRAPVMLAAAIAAAGKRAVSRDMARKLDATGICALAHFGNVPLEAMASEQARVGFLLWLRRLPAGHGKAHGRNRHATIGRTLSKQAEIDAADAADAAARAVIETGEAGSLRQQRTLLADALVTRLSDDSVERRHARLKAIFEAAIHDLGWTHPLPVSVLREYKRQAAILDKRCDDPLALRVTGGKQRVAWSNDRLARLCMSPIYQGCASPHRRWKPGEMIIRDSLYWVPLMVMAAGARIEEALQLRTDDIVWRNGVFRLRFEQNADTTLKNDQSARCVPIPKLLLDLGFIEWWREQRTRGGDLLFPEATLSSSDARLSDLFGKRRSSVLRHIGVAAQSEDFYALRKTCATRMLHAGATNPLRQAVLGHEPGEVIDKHYTDVGEAAMKQALDAIDWGIEIAPHPKRGFPVIVACTLACQATLDLHLVLDDDGAARSVEIFDPSQDNDARLLGVAIMRRGERSAPRRAGMRTATPAQAGVMMLDVLAGRMLRLVGGGGAAAERAYETLLALGAATREALDASAGRKIA